MDKFEYKWQRDQERWARARSGGRDGRGAGDQELPGAFRCSAAIVIAIGVVFLLDNLGIVRVSDVWQYWPVILIAAGVFRIVASRSHTAMVMGAILACIGALFLLTTSTFCGSTGTCLAGNSDIMPLL